MTAPGYPLIICTYMLTTEEFALAQLRQSADKADHHNKTQASSFFR